MVCTYGSEKKYPTDSTIVVDPYQGVNPVAETFMRLALIPQPFEFDADEICSSEPPEYIPVNVADFAIGSVLYIKVEQNSKREAWFKGCQCKAAPTAPPPEEIPQPPELEPPNVDLPELPPFGSSGFSCNGVTKARWIWEVRGWNGDPKQGVIGAIYFEAADVTGTPSVDVFNSSNPRVYALYVNAVPRFVSTVNDQYDWKLTYCQGEPVEEPPKGDEPPIPSPCPDSGENDCLKQPDKADIISDLRLWTSESNNRVRDELIADSDSRFVDLKTYISTETTTIINNDQNNLSVLEGLIRAKFEFLENNLDNKDRILKEYIDGAKNQILLAIAANTATVLTAITASTTAITAAIATATTTITGAITTATTTINNAINGAKDSIENTVKSEVEKYAPRYRKLTLVFAATPQGISLTYGLRDAPDKYALGWIQFYRKGNGTAKYYYDRQFVINLSQDFVCPEPNIDAGYVLHILPNYRVSASLSWTTKKE